jgi:beta-lactamase regulating signal transducer with metallopeptidase domain
MSLTPMDLLVLVAKASVVLAATAGLAWALRRRSASVRHLVWALGLAGVLALPLAALVVPPVAVPVLTVRTEASAPEPVPHIAAPPAVSTPAPKAAVTVAPPPAAPAPAPRGPARVRAWLPQTAGGWIGLVWAAGAGLVLVRYGLGLARLAYWSRRAALVTDPAWLSLAHALAGRIGLHRGVTLLRGHGPHVPMTWGVLRPVIWIPEEADAWAEERRAVVLAHELAHIRRRDALVGWVGHVALALHWFNPLAHVAVRRLRQEREHACDDLVLALGTPGATYADHLLAIVRALGETRSPSLAFAMARRSQFEGRLLAILDPRAARRRPRALNVAMGLALGMVSVALLAAIEPGVRVVAASGAARTVGAEPAPPQAAALDAPLVPQDTTRAAIRDLARRYGITERLARQIAGAAQAERVPVAVAFTLVERQSGFDARRESARGAVGLTQILPSTARLVRPGVTRTALFDPETNLRVGLRYLRRMLVRTGGNVEAAFAAYHTGRVADDDSDEQEVEGGLVGDPGADVPAGEDLAAIVGSIGSDSERALVVRAAMTATPLTEARMGDLLAAVETLSSDGDRASLYMSLIGQGLEGSARVALLRSLTQFESSGECASVLQTFASRYGLDATTAGPYLAAAERLSDGDRAAVFLTALASAARSGVLERLLDATEAFDSDGDAARVLLSAVPRIRTAAERAAYLRAARRLKSDGDKARVLMALEGARTSEARQEANAANDTPREIAMRSSNVRLNDAGDAVASIAPGGSLDLAETTEQGVRRVLVRPGAAGLAYTYSLDGTPQAFDAEGRAWLRSAIVRARRASNGRWTL